MTDDSNPETEWAREDEDFLAFLGDVTAPKTKLARAYVAATSTEQLLILAVEPLCLSAADIFFTVNSPGRLNIAADLQKRLTPKRYWAEFARTHALVAQCLLCVVEKFEEFCRRAGLEISAHQFHQLAVRVADYWQSINRYPEGEKKAFRDEVIRALTHARQWELAKGSDRLRRIMDATGKRLSDDVVVKLVMATQDPITRLEPLFFAERFKQLTGKR